MTGAINFSAAGAAMPARQPVRVVLAALAVTSLMALAGCATTTSDDTIRIDRAQGSEENISSLTSVINSNPSDPEAYNSRGSALGKAGRFKDAMNDFNRAIQLNPRYYQAYANRALVERSIGKQVEAVQDYNTALQINPRYDVAYIGRGDIYRLANRLDEAMADFNKAIELDTTDGRAYHRRGLIFSARASTRRRSTTSRPPSRCRRRRRSLTTAAASPIWRRTIWTTPSRTSTTRSILTARLPNPGPTKRWSMKSAAIWRWRTSPIRMRCSSIPSISRRAKVWTGRVPGRPAQAESRSIDSFGKPGPRTGLFHVRRRRGKLERPRFTAGAKKAAAVSRAAL